MADGKFCIIVGKNSKNACLHVDSLDIGRYVCRGGGGV